MQNYLFDEITPEYIEGSGVSIDVLNIDYIKPHRHSDAIEMIYCLQGSFEIKIAHETIVCCTGEMVTADHDDIHYVIGHEGNICIVVHLSLLGTPFSQDELDATLFSCSTSRIRDVQEPFIEMMYDKLVALACLNALPHNADFVQKIEVIRQNIIALLVDKFSWYSMIGFTAEENKKYRDRINSISLYIQNNYNKKVTLKKLADMTYMDANYLSSFIKKTSMLSYSFTLNYFRCYEAEKLLLETNRSVQEISDMCSFSSKKYFHKHFKEIWGTTPLQHRKAYKKLYALKENFQPVENDFVITASKEWMMKRHLDRVYRSKSYD